MAHDERNSRVFVVSGRNHVARDALIALLRTYQLTVVDWEAAVALTGRATPHAREVLEAGFRAVGAVVVLLSGDDEVRLCAEYASDLEGDDQGVFAPQPRPNVLIEAGIALGLHPESTVMVQMGRLRRISDFGGLQFVTLDDSLESRRILFNRLRVAGCKPRSPAAEPDPVLPPTLGGERDLPPVRESLGRASAAFVKKVRSFFPVARMGGHLEIVEDARVGDALTLSIWVEGESNITVQYWRPGAWRSQSLGSFTLSESDSTLEVPLTIEPPAGYHYFDVVASSHTAEAQRTIARARCLVRE